LLRGYAERAGRMVGFPQESEVCHESHRFSLHVSWALLVAVYASLFQWMARQRSMTPTGDSFLGGGPSPR